MAGLRYVDVWSASNLSPLPPETVSEDRYPAFVYMVPVDLVLFFDRSRSIELCQTNTC